MSEWRLKPASDIAIDVVIPVLNEAHVLEANVRKVHAFFGGAVPHRWRIVIAENGSTDETVDVGRRIADALPHVEVIVVPERGRGRALQRAWGASPADIVCYTDVDLSTDLEAFPRLFRALIDDRYDIAIGTRLARESKTTRSLKRQLISLAYNALLKVALKVGFTDAQTGFKAITKEIVRNVLPLVEDQSWFLDTEMLVIAEWMGYRIADIPIVWVEDDDSRVKIMRTAWEDVKGVIRLRRHKQTILGRAGVLMATRQEDRRESAVR
ncbi:MAG: glycosyltransferase [Acidobacteria bacterium]|nr:glycosyltransferase [Acidobacteriota bacterium]